MLHVLTAGVGSTCEVRVRSGSAFEGIFKTLSSKFELALDAVHRRAPLPPPDTPGRGPRREDIVDTMIFRAGDVVLARLRNVDFAFAAREKFGGGAGARLNGEHKEKVLQRWEGGDGAHDYDLDADLSNGWDPNEMFKFNEEAYGVRSSYDSSLAAYTVPLERGSSPAFRQREARAAALAREIEAGPRHRRDDGDDEEGGGGEEERPGGPPRTPAPPGPPSGRDSPAGAAPRESKYPPLPQRVRGGGGLRCGSARGGGGGGLRCGSARGGGGRPGGGSLPPPRGAPPHPHPEPGLNGGPSRMSPKSQRPLRGGGGKAAAGGGARPAETPPAPPAAGRMYPPRSPKAAAPPPQDPPGGDPRGEGPPPNPPPSPQAGGAPPPPKEPLPPPGAKDGGRALEAPGPPEPPRAPGKGGPQAEPQRSQLEELRKFGAQFKLQPSSAAEPPPEPLPPRGPEPPEGRGRGPEGPPEAEGGAEEKGGGAGTPPGTPPGKGEGEEKEEGPVAEQVKKSTLNPNAKEFNPSKPLLAVNKSASTPTSPGPRAHPSPSLGVLAAAGGGGGVYGPPYISYIPQLHVGPAPVQAPQMYPYPVSGAQQGKYRGAKGSLPLQRSEQHPPASAPPPLVPAAAAGPPLVAAAPPPPYSSYISYGPQQFGGQPPLVQPLPHYPSQPVFAPMLPGSPRLLPSGSHPPPAIVSSSAPQYPPAEQPPPPQTLYAAVHQPYPPHAAPLHPQPPPTPTGAQPPPQHAAPSPAQHQGGQPPHLGGAQPQQPPQQSLFHAAAALGAAPPALPPPPAPPGAPSPQSSFPPPAPPPPPPPPPAAAAAAVYALHQSLQHGYGVAHVGQAHVQTGLPAAPPPHPGAPHPPQVMLLHPPQSHGGPPQGGVPQSGVGALPASSPSPYTYIGHHQVQSHPSQQLPFHPPGN